MNSAELRNDLIRQSVDYKSRAQRGMLKRFLLSKEGEGSGSLPCVLSIESTPSKYIRWRMTTNTKIALERGSDLGLNMEEVIRLLKDHRSSPSFSKSLTDHYPFDVDIELGDFYDLTGKMINVYVRLKNHRMIKFPNRECANNGVKLASYPCTIRLSGMKSIEIKFSNEHLAKINDNDIAGYCIEYMDSVTDYMIIPYSTKISLNNEEKPILLKNSFKDKDHYRLIYFDGMLISSSLAYGLYLVSNISQVTGTKYLEIIEFDKDNIYINKQLSPDTLTKISGLAQYTHKQISRFAPNTSESGKTSHQYLYNMPHKTESSKYGTYIDTEENDVIDNESIILSGIFTNVGEYIPGPFDLYFSHKLYDEENDRYLGYNILDINKTLHNLGFNPNDVGGLFLFGLCQLDRAKIDHATIQDMLIDYYGREDEEETEITTTGINEIRKFLNGEINTKSTETTKISFDDRLMLEVPMYLREELEKDDRSTTKMLTITTLKRTEVVKMKIGSKVQEYMVLDLPQQNFSYLIFKNGMLISPSHFIETEHGAKLYVNISSNYIAIDGETIQLKYPYYVMRIDKNWSEKDGIDTGFSSYYTFKSSKKSDNDIEVPTVQSFKLPDTITYVDKTGRRRYHNDILPGVLSDYTHAQIKEIISGGKIDTNRSTDFTYLVGQYPDGDLEGQVISLSYDGTEFISSNALKEGTYIDDRGVIYLSGICDGAGQRTGSCSNSSYIEFIPPYDGKVRITGNFINIYRNRVWTNEYRAKYDVEFVTWDVDVHKGEKIQFGERFYKHARGEEELTTSIKSIEYFSLYTQADMFGIPHSGNDKDFQALPCYSLALFIDGKLTPVEILDSEPIWVKYEVGSIDDVDMSTIEEGDVITVGDEDSVRHYEYKDGSWVLKNSAYIYTSSFKLDHAYIYSNVIYIKHIKREINDYTGLSQYTHKQMRLKAPSAAAGGKTPHSYFKGMPHREVKSKYTDSLRKYTHEEIAALSRKASAGNRTPHEYLKGIPHSNDSGSNYLYTDESDIFISSVSRCPMVYSPAKMIISGNRVVNLLDPIIPSYCDNKFPLVEVPLSLDYMMIFVNGYLMNENTIEILSSKSFMLKNLTNLGFERDENLNFIINDISIYCNLFEYNKKYSDYYYGAIDGSSIYRLKDLYYTYYSSELISKNMRITDKIIFSETSSGTNKKFAKRRFRYYDVMDSDLPVGKNNLTKFLNLPISGDSEYEDMVAVLIDGVLSDYTHAELKDSESTHADLLNLPHGRE